jgi:membrane associated rhomboid family serine protease
MRHMEQPGATPRPSRMTYAAVLPFLAVLALWLIHLIDRGLDLHLERWGIGPRDWSGLVGVFAAPLLHGDLEHLIGNSVPLFVLGWSLMYFFPTIAGRIVLFSWFFTGIGVWVSARANIHIGASGVVYALAAFLFISGLLRRQRTQMGLSLLIVFLYGSMFWGIFPILPRVSWESHLWGAATGVVLAWLYRREPSAVKDPTPVLVDDDEEGMEEQERGELEIVYHVVPAAEGATAKPASAPRTDTYGNETTTTGAQ